MARPRKVVESDTVQESASMFVLDPQPQSQATVEVTLKTPQVGTYVFHYHKGFVEFFKNKANVSKEVQALLTKNGVI